ncbi:MAG: nucleotidyl transferase AbiEii/AbiGii toxin family protein [Candidatus Roizmanbacteria bacterium]|nr:nucleotidyl transferase AbiEii/AbiGii toxin family protein [Candidatus Roizmanbacteria bacterium]
MGKIGFTPFQKIIFDKISQEKSLRETFYFGGGTALSVFYFNHRYSIDLDFFSEKEFDKDIVIQFINSLSTELGTSVKMTKKEMVMWFEISKEKKTLKIDFFNFPYPRIDKNLIYQGIDIDSPKDIGANKLLLLNLSEEPKDYVDLYFILKEKYSIWDLLDAVKVKFKLELDLISLGEDFLNAEKIKFLPLMIKPLTLDELKSFFKLQATKLGTKII